MFRFIVVSTVMISFMAVSIAPAADGVVGWRGEGTGKYPQAEPLLEWSTEKNVIWRTPIESWSNAIPTVVGDRLFTCAEPTKLICVSTISGKVLWEATVRYEDAFSKEELAKFNEMKKQVMAEMKPIDAEIKRLSDEIKKQTAPILAPVKELDAQVRKLQKEMKEQDKAIEEETKKKINAEIAKLREEIGKLRKEADGQSPEKRKKVRELQEARKILDHKRRSLDVLALPAKHPVNGYSTPTPVSDGKRVHVLMSTGVAACFDMDGTRIWTRFIEKPTHGWGHSASPVLADGKLIVHVLRPIALDVKTGKELWRAESKPHWGSPVVTRIGDQDVVITANGEVIRASDGIVQARGVSWLEYCTPVVSDGVAYFIQNGGKAIKLPDAISGDSQFKALWTTKPRNDRYYASPIVHEGLIYAVTQKGAFSVIDAGDGKVIYEKKLDVGKGTFYPSIVLGGKHLFVSIDNGTTLVLKPGREYKEVAKNTLAPFRSTPVFVGKRMYIRGQKHLYCIGSK